MHLFRAHRFSSSFVVVAAAVLLVDSQKPAAEPALGSVTPPSSGSLLQAGDLGYVGSFRVPTGADLTYDHSGHGLTFDPQRNSLFVANFGEEVSEISIPTPGTGASVSSLPRANLLQGPVKVLRGRESLAGDQIGGILVDGNSLIVSMYKLYDANGSGSLSHFRVSKDFSQTAVVGPLPLGMGKAGFVGGPMARIPSAWQSLLGGPALTGLCCVSIISRSSYGPTATVFDPANVNASTTKVPGTMVLGYPDGHESLGDWNSSYTLFNNATEMAGMVWVEGTDSILFFGRKGDSYCYGEAATCGDPTSNHKGDHAYPYDYFVWAYDANELLAVKQGARSPWDVMPYATWKFNMPFATGARMLRGVAYDPGTQRIFLAEQKADGAHVLIRVLQLGVASVPMPANAQPIVQASCNPCSADAGQPVTISAQAADPDGDPMTYAWQGNGGSFGNAQAATTSFTSSTAGATTLTVTVNDGRGGIGIAAVNVSFVQPGTSAPTNPPTEKPETTEPKPTEPPKEEPTTTQPAPTAPTEEPKPAEPAPTPPTEAPQTTEPTPTNPPAAAPTPTEPAPTEPQPTEPAPTEPVPTEPTPTEPAPEAPTASPQPEDSLLLLPACTEPDPWELLGGGVCIKDRWFPPNTKAPRKFRDEPDDDKLGSCITPDPYALLGGGVCRGGTWYPNLRFRGRGAEGVVAASAPSGDRDAFVNALDDRRGPIPREPGRAHAAAVPHGTA